MQKDRIFHTASAEEVISGKTTDIYFERSLSVLKARGIDKRVVAEVRAREIPGGHPWAVYAGLEEVVRLLERVRLKAEVRSIDEGTVFGAEDVVFSIDGRYNEFGIYETAILGFLCQASGIATAAARCKKAAGTRTLLSFGARRMHPCIAPMIDRSAYIGGVDGVSAIASAELLGMEPSGTMPHALILLVGDTVEASRAFREVISRKVKCVSLIDTFNDEKVESLNVARALGKDLFAVRVDTPASRRGNLAEILAEIRWELDINGFTRVKIFVSGGMDEEKIAELNPWADGYGVGTRIAGAPVVDYSFDIVEIEGKPVAKRGKKSGAKKLVRCPRCFTRRSVRLKAAAPRCACGATMKNIHRAFIKGGKLSRRLPTPRQIRSHAMKELERLELEHYV